MFMPDQHLYGHFTKIIVPDRKKIPKLSTLCLTKLSVAFTSQIEDKRIPMESLSSCSEAGSNDPAGSADWANSRTEVTLSLVLDCRARAVADREARPGLK
jgi:hypothetical protein